ncbi:hypothetical protein FO519_009775 [Halicephalobus sp. NKZ332]|nr:hypothetical protein FO519_009775 [Halicephalobus sp. NKZ332]
MIFQPVVALNRLIMVVFPLQSHIFDRKKTIICGMMTLFLGFLGAFLVDFVVPCCIPYVYYGVYSYFYVGTGFNYVDHYIDLPFNTTIFFVSILLYIIIFIYVRKHNTNTSGLTQRQVSSRKNKEVRYAIQFGLCTIFAFSAWLTFRIFPLLVPSNQLHLFTVIGMCVILHCTANSLIFMTFNKEFRDRFLGKSVYINGSNAAPQFSTNAKNISAAKVTPSEGTPQNDQQ